MSAATNISRPSISAPPAISVVASSPLDSAEFRRRVRTISRQAAIYFSGTIFAAAAGFFLKIYLARVLGAEALGLYTLGMSIVGFLALFISAGLPTAATRFIAEYCGKGEFARLNAFLRASLGLLVAANVLLGAGVIWAGPWIALHFYHTPQLNPYFWLFAMIMFFAVVNTFLGQAMAGYQDVERRTVVTNFVGAPANILLAVVFISLGLGLKGYLAAQVASSLLIMLLLAVSLWKLTPPPARVASRPARLEKGVVLFSASAFGLATIEFLLSQADKIMLGHYLDPRQVGIYALATALVGLVPIALQSVNQIFSPVIAELHATGDRKLLQQLYAALTKWIVIITLPLVLTFVMCSHSLIAIFGKGYEAGGAVLIVGAIGQLFNCAVGSVGYLLLMTGNQAQLIAIETCNAVLVIGLSIFMIPRFGITGAAVAAAVAVIITNLWSLAAVSRKLKLFPYNPGYFKLLPAILVSAAVLFGLQHAIPVIHGGWRMVVPATFGAYASFLGTLLLFGLDSDDRRLALLLWNRFGTRFRQNEMMKP